MPIKVALVGFGKSATVFHLPLLRVLNEYEVDSVISSRPDEVYKVLPQAKVFASLEEALAKSFADLYIITTPHHLHYVQAKQILEAGKHVVVEKPFVMRVSEGEELIKIAEEKQVVLSVYHNRRWDSGFLTLQKLMREQSLGEISFYECRYERYRPEVQNRWRENDPLHGGLWWDLAPHLIDQALMLFGEPDNYHIDTAIQREKSQVIDYFQIIFKYQQRRVLLKANSLAHYKAPHLLVHGTKASFLREEMDSQEEALKLGLDPSSANWGGDLQPCSYLITHDAIETKPIDAVPGTYEAFYKLIHQSITQKTEPPVTGQEALKVIRILESLALPHPAA